MTVQDYLDQNELSVEEFKRFVHLSRATVYRALSGLPILRHSAAKIVNATKGKVTFEDLGFLK